MRKFIWAKFLAINPRQVVEKNKNVFNALSPFRMKGANYLIDVQEQIIDGINADDTIRTQKRARSDRADRSNLAGRLVRQVNLRAAGYGVG